MKELNKKVLVIVDTFEEYCQGMIWDGVVEQAELDGIDLVTFPVTSQWKYDHLQTHYFFIKEFLDNSLFDGILVFTGAITEHTTVTTLKAMMSHTDLPVVSIAGELGRECDIIINNKPGIIALIDHLVNEHGAKNIAFVKGPRSNPEAQERFEAYREGLAKNGLQYNELLVCEGNFSESSGVAAVTKLIESGELFDVIIGADDSTALGVLSELKKQSLEVPEVVRVAGFDDIEEAFLSSPSLTTVRQPFQKLGKRAVDSLIMAWNSSGVPEKVVSIDTFPVFRESCSCSPEDIKVMKKNNLRVRRDYEKVSDCHESLQHIVHCSSVKELSKTLLHECEQLNIEEFLMVLFDDDESFGNSESTSFLIKKYDGGYEMIRDSFSSADIITPAIAQNEKQENAIWLPLVFNELYFGYIYCRIESEHPKLIFEELRSHISIALQLIHSRWK